MQYLFTKHKGYILLQTDKGQVLLDTGSPISFGSGPSKLGFPNKSNINPVLSLNSLNNYLNTDLIGLIGGDLLTNTNLHIDWQTETCTFGESNSHFGWKMNLIKNVPVIECYTFGKYAYFDTGAPVSYLKKSPHWGNYIQTGRKTDFHPLIGTFETDIYTYNIKLNACEFSLHGVGTLPEKLESQLLSDEIPFILGNSLFSTFSKVTLDYQNKFFHIES